MLSKVNRYSVQMWEDDSQQIPVTRWNVIDVYKKDSFEVSGIWCTCSQQYQAEITAGLLNAEHEAKAVKRELYEIGGFKFYLDSSLPPQEMQVWQNGKKILTLKIEE